MEIRTNEPMARHTSFRVGGPADRFMIPESEEELREAVLDCKASGKPWYMVGNGSNLLVGDKGFRGTIISTERLTELEVQKNENSIIAGAGVMLSKLANTAAREKLTGLEFAAGIPGTVGGAVMMNAGAYGSEMKLEVSIDEPLNVDWDGNELLLSDILGTDEDVIYKDMEDEVEKDLLKNAVSRLSPRERKIVELRYGLKRQDGAEMTQKEVADLMGISQSYISRLEKKIMMRLKKEIVKFE